MVAVGVPVWACPVVCLSATQLVRVLEAPLQTPVLAGMAELIVALVVAVSSEKPAAPVRPVTVAAVRLAASRPVGVVQVDWKIGSVQYIISIEPMVAVEVAIVAATVCLALAPLPPLPGETALPPASVLILPLAEELKVILRDVSWAASARPGFTIGKTSANTNKDRKSTRLNSSHSQI